MQQSNIPYRQPIVNIYYSRFHDDQYIEILIELPANCIIYRSIDFFIAIDKQILGQADWQKLDSYQLEDNTYITDIAVLEGVACFIKFSNDDILHIYDHVYGYGDWYQDVEVIKKIDTGRYKTVFESMNDECMEKLAWLKPI